MIHLKMNDVLELSIAKMLRHEVPRNEAEISSPIYLEGELWGKRTHGFRYLEGCLLQYQEGATRKAALLKTGIVDIEDPTYEFLQAP